MRIAFCGKGGSGKTALASLYTASLLRAGRAVCAIDADINQTLGNVLGLDDEAVARLPDLGTDAAFLKNWLRGDNPRIPSNDLMMKSTPPGSGSRMLRPGFANPVFDHYAFRSGNLSFLKVGGFQDSDIGTHCYHAKTGSVELLLNHMLDGQDDTIVVDMTAGADAFASGLFTRFDLTVLVVEPTLQSVGVFRQYCDYAAQSGIRIAAVGNKVEGAEDLAFLRERLGNMLVACIGRSAFIRDRDRGVHHPFENLEPENRAALAAIETQLRKQRRDWNEYWRQTVHFHLLNAESWANAVTGENLGLQVDRDFLERLQA